MTIKQTRVWEETILLPTYRAAEPEKNPLFLENRAYQGSTGKVYPLQVTEKIADEKEDVAYQAVCLENDYLYVMILPELGGRIQRALDKTNHYDFVYYNHVIKPALVGLAGPWVSGGIEFNWPQHHRPSTFSPVDYCYQANEDGSASVIVSEIDRMYGTKGMATFTLYPDRAYIEIKGQLYNHTDLPQTFLWWANPAVPVNEHTYSVFPPDVHAVMDHGKRAVSTFPVATGEYYKYDYSEGIDISRYRNIKVPTSYMAAHSDYDFIGNYDESRDAGLLHVADHHISPGKKQWTWGNSDFGQAWDRNLTDEDGPYIELMTGVFADNQPDFTWLKPNEEKTFTQYFMPYKHVGRVKNASKDAAVAMEPEGGRIHIKAYASGLNQDAVVSLYDAGGREIFRETCTLSPTRVYDAYIPLPADASANACAGNSTACGPATQADSASEAGITHCDSLDGFKVSIRNAAGGLLVEYRQLPQELTPTPKPADPLPAPGRLGSTEECYLAAQHLEQYRHATYAPEDYYLEGLRRDPSDIRLNHGYGLLLYRRGNFRESIPYLYRAIRKQCWKNTNPYDGETYYHLGLALLAAGEDPDYEIPSAASLNMTDAGYVGNAYDAFYKATWSGEQQSSAFYQLACLECRAGNYERSLTFAELSLVRNWHNMRTRTLKAALLRLLGKADPEYLKECHRIDPLYFGILYEEGLYGHGLNTLAGWKRAMRRPVHNYLELALEYLHAGLYQDALTILSSCEDASPMRGYYIAYVYAQFGSVRQRRLSRESLTLLRDEGIRPREGLDTEEQAALKALIEAEGADYAGCFPNRISEIAILNTAIDLLGKAPRAHYYLGCLYYDKKQYALAKEHWSRCACLEDPSFAPAWRNLAIHCYNRELSQPGNDSRATLERALGLMKTALPLEPDNSRFLLEYDQLSTRCREANETRLALLTRHMELVNDRDTLTLEYITLLNDVGRYDEALSCLSSHIFHPWEGGEGKVSGQYRYALTQKAITLLQEAAQAPDEDARADQIQLAISLLQETKTYPANLGEGKLPNVQDTIADYYLGIAYERTGDSERSRRHFLLASVGLSEPSSVLYYNDQPSDTILYQGLANEKLGNRKEAHRAYHQLLSFGQEHLFDEVSYDYFAVSLPEIEVFPESIASRNDIYCRYLIALGHLGLGDTARAAGELKEILALQPGYQGAIRHLMMIGRGF